MLCLNFEQRPRTRTHHVQLGNKWAWPENFRQERRLNTTSVPGPHVQPAAVEDSPLDAQAFRHAAPTRPHSGTSRPPFGRREARRESAAATARIDKPACSHSFKPPMITEFHGRFMLIPWVQAVGRPLWLTHRLLFALPSDPLGLARADYRSTLAPAPMPPSAGR